MNKILRKNRANCTSGGGFTLAELLIVVAVIAVLVAVAIPTFGNQLEKSRQATDLSNLREAYAAAKLAILNQGESDVLHENAPPELEEDETSKEVEYWYNVDRERLVASKPSGASRGKATSGTVQISESVAKIPSVIKYEDAQLAKGEDDGDTIGATAKAVLVTFEYTKKSGEYTLKEIKFAYKAENPVVLSLAVTPSSVKINGTLAGTDTPATPAVPPTAPTFTVTYDGVEITDYTVEPNAVDATEGTKSTTTLGAIGLKLTDKTFTPDATDMTKVTTAGTDDTVVLTFSYTPAGSKDAVTKEVTITATIVAGPTGS